MAVIAFVSEDWHLRGHLPFLRLLEFPAFWAEKMMVLDDAALAGLAAFDDGLDVFPILFLLHPGLVELVAHPDATALRLPRINDGFSVEANNRFCHYLTPQRREVFGRDLTNIAHVISPQIIW